MEPTAPTPHASPVPALTAQAATAAIPPSASLAPQAFPCPPIPSAASTLAATLLTALPAQAPPAATSARPASWLPIASPRNAQSATARPVQAPPARAVCLDTPSPVMELACLPAKANAQTASLQESAHNAQVDTSLTTRPIPARWIAAWPSEVTANPAIISFTAVSASLATCRSMAAWSAKR